jgi:hypothetical protein
VILEKESEEMASHPGTDTGSPLTMPVLAMVQALDPVTSRMEMGLEIQSLRQALLQERQRNEVLEAVLSKQTSELTMKLKESEIKILFLQEAIKEDPAREQKDELLAKISQYEAKLLFFETEYERQQNFREKHLKTFTRKHWNLRQCQEQDVPVQNSSATLKEADLKVSSILNDIEEHKPQNQKVRKWEAYFAKLVAFKKEHGHCNVSTKKDDLSRWVAKLRQHHKDLRLGKPSTLLTRDRIQRLNEIGFIWRDNDTKALSFEVRLAQLAEYKARHGHCNVPRDAKDCPPGLGNFVFEQRKHYHLMKIGGETKSKSFTQERVNALEALGFQWRLRKFARRVSGEDNRHHKRESSGDE